MDISSISLPQFEPDELDFLLQVLISPNRLPPVSRSFESNPFFDDQQLFFDESNDVVAVGHGAVCMVMTCNRVSRTRGLCRIHGGGRKCKREGCEKRDQKRGLCAKHGGVDICIVQDCGNVARVAQRCNKHKR